MTSIQPMTYLGSLAYFSWSFKLDDVYRVYCSRFPSTTAETEFPSNSMTLSPFIPSLGYQHKQAPLWEMAERCSSALAALHHPFPQLPISTEPVMSPLWTSQDPRLTPNRTGHKASASSCLGVVTRFPNGASALLWPLLLRHTLLCCKACAPFLTSWALANPCHRFST